MTAGPATTSGRRASATRPLLQIAAFSAVQAVVIIVLAPFTPHVAAWFPPAYALVAFLQTLLIFAARRFTGIRWGATLAAGVTALVCGPFTAIGWLLAVPLLAAAVLFDLVVGLAERRSWRTQRDSIVVALVVGTALFLVSLPVMSVEHLGPVIVILTLFARIVATWVGAFLSARLVHRLERLGVSAHRVQTEPRVGDASTGSATPSR
ncbi:hypothetical protein ACTJKK_13095 [Microbacterium sp. 22179]|jgi:hypothetical protein|uniref:hypothetical protein n=1 Tax=Microbacterium sp. 22179 TaxID=3453886 RepID=UPI003F834BD4